MSDVACICSAPIVAEARLRGLDPAPLIEGLGISMNLIEDPNRRIPWKIFAEFAGRASKMLGPATIQDLAAKATVDFAPRPLRRILPHLRDSKPLFLLAPRWWGPWVFRGSRGTCEALPDGRLREVVRILPEFEACPEFLEGLEGTLRGMPRLLGQPDALVTANHDGREAEFIITPPPARAGGRPTGLLDRDRGEWPRVRFQGSFLALGRRRERRRAQRELDAVGFARERALEDARTIHRLSAELNEKTKSLAALDRLSMALLEADPSNYAKLREGIAELVLDELGIRGVRLIPRAGKNREEAEDAVAGAAHAAPDRSVSLCVGAREVGCLELMGPISRQAELRLEILAPWIAFSLECGGSKTLTKHLISLLSEGVQDWDRMEQRLAALHAEKSGKGRLH